MGKDLTGVRSPQRKLMPNTVKSDKHKPTSLWGIASKLAANASTTEEPREGKLHAGICAGMPGNRHSYRDYPTGHSGASLKRNAVAE